VSGEVLLELKGVRLSFGQVRAVDGVDLAVAKGDLTAIIGPNGAGKTTLFNLITGRYRPDSGRITLDGQDISGRPSHQITRRGVARSFQITNIFPSLTVAENVQVALQITDRQTYRLLADFRPLGRERVAEILDLVGLTDKAGHPAGELSHGDQRTLEIALTLALRPRLLLLDEPTSGMSSWETSLVTDLIGRISTEMDLTVLFVEHDMSVAFSAAKKVVVMHQGRVFAQGEPEAIRCNEAVRAVYLGEEE